MEREVRAKTHAAEGGSQRTVYVEHGIWVEGAGKIMCTIGETPPREVKPDDPRYGIYRAILVEHGRWTEDADR